MLSMASPIIFRCTFFFFPFHIVFSLVQIMKVVSRPISYFHIWCLSSGEHGDYMQLCKYNCSPPVNLHDWLQVRKFCQQRVTYSTLSLSTSLSDETIIFGTYAVALSHCTVNLCEWYMVTNLVSGWNDSFSMLDVDWDESGADKGALGNLPGRWDCIYFLTNFTMFYGIVQFPMYGTKTEEEKSHHFKIQGEDKVEDLSTEKPWRGVHILILFSSLLQVKT